MMFKFHIYNPFKTWWKARKYFKFPELKLYCGKYVQGGYFNSKYNGKLLHIEIYDVGWKWKWGTVRHESNPVINFIFFNRWQLHIDFRKSLVIEDSKEDASLMYWETVLDYLYHSKDLHKAVKNNSGWCKHMTSPNGDYIEYKYDIPKICLNKNGYTEYNRNISIDNRNTNS